MPGFFLFEDGLCYPIPGATVTVEPVPTPESVIQDFGSPPCREGYVQLVGSNRCFPEADTIPTTVTPVPTAGPDGTTPTDTGVACAEPNFFVDASGNCFLTIEGQSAGCSLNEADRVPRCP